MTGSRPVVAFAPGAVGPSQALAVRISPSWPRARGRGLCGLGAGRARREARSRPRSSSRGGRHVRDLTGTDLRNAILALAAADVAVSNDSGLLHVAAAIGTPTDRHFRPDQPVALGAAQSARRDDRDDDRRALPALPQADLPDGPPPLHARHPGHNRDRGGAARDPDLIT